MTDAEGDVFLDHVSGYMAENLSAEMIQILYNRYQENKNIEDSQQVETSVEDAQHAIDEAKSQKDNANEAEDTAGQTGTEDENETAGSQNSSSEEVAENPLELVLSLKQNALLGMVTGDAGNLSAKHINLTNCVETRTCQNGTITKQPNVNAYDKVLVIEYIDQYFADYLSPADEHTLSYEMEYVLGGKESDKDNLESVVNRLLLMREVANVSYILSDSQKRTQAATLAGTLAGFTGNSAVIKVVEIGIVAAWAYVESILDVRALLDGDKIALMKNGSQWMTQLGSFSAAIANGAKTQNCENGLGYLDYVKGFLFTMNRQKMAYRMMNVIEQNIRMVPSYKNCQMDHILCRLDYEIDYSAELLFSRMSIVGKKDFLGLSFGSEKKFSYYD